MNRITSEKDTSLYGISKEQIAPVLYSYVFWILNCSRKKNLTTLYFLARDGYVLKQIAEMICKNKGWQIECRYLYCSRASLCMPTYYFVGEEAYDRIFASGYFVVLRTFFDRIGMNDDDIDCVMQEIDIADKVELDKELSEKEISYFREKICTSSYFKDYLMKKSKRAYVVIEDYFKQNGLLENDSIAIVDSGWIGSMQHFMRILLNRMGWNGQITGFYFGLYTNQREIDGEYLTYYFNWNNNIQNKILFCNNLMEIILSAPHGTTLGYRKNELTNRVEPVIQNLKEDERQKEKISEQIDGILDGIKEIIKNGRFVNRKECQHIVRKIMAFPSKNIVKTYGEFLFCDDITDNYHFSLVKPMSSESLRKQTVLAKAKSRLRNDKKEQLFWEFGTVALLDNPLKRAWYWINFYVWNFARFVIERRKK